jgi:hypothetical protein
MTTPVRCGLMGASYRKRAAHAIADPDAGVDE